jgi:hypothetical protein
MANWHKAIAVYEAALHVFTSEGFPELYPLISKNLDKMRQFCQGK